MSSHWNRVLLGDVSTLQRGISYTSGQIEPPGLPFVTIKCISKGGGFRHSGLKTFAGRVADKDRIFEGDLIIANTDLTRDGSIVGAPALVSEIDDGATFSMDVSRLNLMKSKVDSRFLAARLQLPDAREFMGRISGGSTVIHLQTSKVCDFPFELPDLNEQRRIAEVLGTLDAELQVTERIVRKLKDANQGLLNDLCSLGIGADGRLRDRDITTFRDSRIGVVPETWEVLPAQDVCIEVIDCKNRTPPLADEGYPVIRTTNVRDGEFAPDGLVYTNADSYRIWTQRGAPRPGDVLITREAPVGEVCLVPELDLDVCLGQRMMMYQPDPIRLDNVFMLAALQSRGVQQELADLAGGSTVGHVRVGDVRRLHIPVPPLNEQRRIADIWRNAKQRLSLEIAHGRCLSEVKEGLRADLLTGRVRPAEVAGS